MFHPFQFATVLAGVVFVFGYVAQAASGDTFAPVVHAFARIVA